MLRIEGVMSVFASVALKAMVACLFGGSRNARQAFYLRPSPSHASKTMQRNDCLSAAAAYFDDGRFLADLRRRVAFRTESDTGTPTPALGAYLHEEMSAPLARLGFACEVIDNPVAGGGPFLIARRIEGAELPHRADLRPRRCRQRPGRAMARRPRAVGADDRGRSLVRTRHGRQQGAAHHQPGRACAGGAGTPWPSSAST